MTKTNKTGSFRTATRLIPFVAFCAIFASACGVSDENKTGRKPSNDAGNGGSGATGATGNVGGTGDVSPGGAATDPVPCKEDKKRCNGNTPQKCNADGVWEDGQACGGTTKVCTGDGVCAAYRLVNAGIDSFGVRPKEPVADGLPILKEQTLSAAPRTCNKAGLCVTGGIR